MLYPICLVKKIVVLSCLVGTKNIVASYIDFLKGVPKGSSGLFSYLFIFAWGWGGDGNGFLLKAAPVGVSFTDFV